MKKIKKKPTDITIDDIRPALLLAGKLALKARAVTTANALNISSRVEAM